MTVNVEAQLDNEKATVAGKAKGKEKGKAMIDTEVHHSDYYEHHHDKARDRNIMDLNIEKKGKAAKDMELDARENTPIQVSNSEANTTWITQNLTRRSHPVLRARIVKGQSIQDHHHRRERIPKSALSVQILMRKILSRKRRPKSLKRRLRSRTNRYRIKYI